MDSIEHLPDGGAALHLAIDPDSVSAIPANVGAEITSSTVFGSKYVELVPPDQPSPQNLQAGTRIQGGGKVTVELNTVFEKLVSVLSHVEPAKLNQTLGALSKSLNGRGEKFGQTLVDLDSALANLNPALDNLNHVLEVSPTVFNALADASPDLLTTIGQRHSHQRHHRRPAGQPGCPAAQRHRSGRHRNRGAHRQPPAAVRCGAPAGAQPPI